VHGNERLIIDHQDTRVRGRAGLGLQWEVGNIDAVPIRCELGHRGNGYFRDRQGYLAGETARSVDDVRATAAPLQALFDQGCTNAARIWLFDGRSVMPPPSQQQLLVFVSAQLPVDRESTRGRGKGAVFARVRAKLMQDESKVKRSLRREPHRRSAT